MTTTQLHDGRRTRLVRGVIGGIVAGVLFIALNAWYVASQGQAPVRPLGLISSIVLGADALPQDVNPALGAAIHLALSAAYGVVFALLVPLFRTNGTVALAGTVYGIGLFAVNFLVLAQTLLPQFQTPNLPVEFMAHALFGLVLALGFYSSGVRRDEPPVGRRIGRGQQLMLRASR
ncbi:MAG: hypothetical protein KY460_15375 [Actinobacteria bacterium]|nr:hypothetical protein [Actinomycetota bacterium]